MAFTSKLSLSDSGTRPLAAGIEDGTFGLRVESGWLFLVACLLLCFDFLADIDVE